MSVLSNKLEEANAKITKARSALFSAIKIMLGDNTHVFKRNANVYATIEEECERLKVFSCSSERVYFEDDSDMDIADIGTDDLNSIVSMIFEETNSK